MRYVKHLCCSSPPDGGILAGDWPGPSGSTHGISWCRPLAVFADTRCTCVRKLGTAKIGLPSKHDQTQSTCSDVLPAPGHLSQNCNEPSATQRIQAALIHANHDTRTSQGTPTAATKPGMLAPVTCTDHVKELISESGDEGNADMQVRTCRFDATLPTRYTGSAIPFKQSFCDVPLLR